MPTQKEKRGEGERGQNQLEKLCTRFKEVYVEVKITLNRTKRENEFKR